MGGVDVIVFTAGIGENTPHIRAAILEGLEYMGVEFDNELNQTWGKEVDISKAGTKSTDYPTYHNPARCN